MMDADGTARFIERGGLPLGMFRNTRYYEYYLPIETGQTLILYTDGATEAQNDEGEEYGRERLENIVREGRSLSARAMIDLIYKDILRWTQGRGSHDDMTFFIIKANY